MKEGRDFAAERSRYTDRIRRVGGRLHDAMARAAALELVLVVMILPLFLLSLRLAWVGLAVVAAVWVVRRLDTGRWLRPCPTNLLALLIVPFLALTLMVTPVPDLTFWQASFLFAGLALYFSIINWALHRQRTWWLMVGILGGLVGVALLSPLLVDEAGRQAFFGGVQVIERLRSLVSERINPNVLAGTLTPMLPAALALMLRPLGENRTQRRVLRILASLATVLLTADVLLMRTRGVLVAAGLVMLLLFLIRWPRTRALVPLLLALGWLVYAEGWLAQLARFLLGDGAFAGLQSRPEIWSRALMGIQDFALTGMGMGTWVQLGPLLYPYSDIGFKTVVPHAHNLLLQVGLDLGLPGLVVFLAFFGLSLWLAWSAYRKFSAMHAVSYATLAVAVWAGLMIILVHGMVDAVTWGTKPAILTWVLLALAAVLFLYAEQLTGASVVGKASSQ